MNSHTLADRGEVSLVDQIVTMAKGRGPQPLLGPGDDAAVVAASDGRVVVTTDMLVEGRHFRCDWSQARDIGHKAAAQNLADIAAMGATPSGIVVALGLPSQTPVAWLEEFVEGLLQECDRAGCALVGGDLVAADSIVVSVTALGDLGGRPAVTRSGARPGDVLALAGAVGDAAGGLAVLSRGFRSPRALVDAHRRPMPDYLAGPRAACAGATAMLDVSDGLVLDASRLAQASGVVVAIDSSALPISDAVRSAAAAYNLDPLTWVLGGGDDHALLATFPAVDLPDGFVAIGEVGAGAAEVLVDGRAVPRSGYEHFPSSPGT